MVDRSAPPVDCPGRTVAPRPLVSLGLKCIWLCAALAVAAAPEPGGEPAFTITTWRTDQGLPGSAIVALSQTPDGYIWAGTGYGLARFDGVEFKTFGLRDGLRSIVISGLLVDRQGTLWVGTSGGGISRYRNGRFETWTRSDGLAGDRITGMIDDKEGALWIWTPTGLSRLAGGKFTTFPAADGLPDRTILAVAQDSDGIIWVATSASGLFQFREGKFVPAAGPPGHPTPLAHSMFCDRRGRLWLGVQSQVLCRNDGRWTSYGRDEGLAGVSEVGTGQFTESADGTIWVAAGTEGLFFLREGRFWGVKREVGLSDQMVTTVLAGQDGAIWAGTRNGLSRLNQPKVAAYGVAQGLPAAPAVSVAESIDGTLWIAMLEKGAYRRNGQSFQHVEMRDDNGIYPTAYSVLAQRNGDLWVGAPRGVLHAAAGQTPSAFCEEQFLPLDAVRAICEAREGGVWVGTGLGRVFRANQGQVTLVTDELAGNFVTALAEGRDGMLWIATSGGLSRFSQGKTSTLTTKDGLLSNQVRALYASPDGALWAGTRGGGLSCWHEGRMVSFTTEHGLPDNSISQILQDDAGDFWFGCSRGIFRVRQWELLALVAGKQRFVHPLVLGRAEGMPATECTGGFHPNALKSTSGMLFFPTMNALATVDPRRFAEVAGPARILLEEVFVDGQMAMSPVSAEGQGLVIGPGRHATEFHFTALGGSAPERVNFKYRLDGLEDWVEAGTERLARYRSIPPGRYRFQVRACNSDGVWGETGPSLAVVVQAHFWQTGWFKVAGVTGLLNVVGLATWWRVHMGHRRKLERLEQARRQQAELAHVSRLSLLGELSASMAHELNQPLTAILANAQAAQRFLAAGQAEPGEFREILKDIASDTTRARDVIRHLRMLVKKGEREFTPLDLNEVIQEVVGFLHGDIVGRNVTVQLDLAPNLPPVSGDRVQLQQVLLNLLLNAFDAMTGNPVGQRQTAIRSFLESPQVVGVTIRDQGVGIAPEKLDRLFDAFYTTKQDGLGMGLSVTRSIVEAHGGRIWAENNAGRGAAFHFTLRAATQTGDLA